MNDGDAVRMNFRRTRQERYRRQRCEVRGFGCKIGKYAARARVTPAGRIHRPNAFARRRTTRTALRSLDRTAFGFSLRSRVDRFLLALGHILPPTPPFSKIGAFLDAGTSSSAAPSVNAAAHARQRQQ
jgi:hypothetical protein